MWNNSAHFLMVRVKVHDRWGFMFPISLHVVNEWLEALGDLVRLGEGVLKFVPLPQEAGSRRQIIWIRTLSPSRIISFVNVLLKDLSDHKGLNVVDVEAGNIQVKVSLR